MWTQDWKARRVAMASANGRGENRSSKMKRTIDSKVAGNLARIGQCCPRRSVALFGTGTK
jgi:hypothetical protein